MSDNDVKLLEKLLVEFEGHIGHRFCIAYPVIQDGFCVGIYDSTSGDLKKSASSYDLPSCINRIKTEHGNS